MGNIRVGRQARSFAGVVCVAAFVATSSPARADEVTPSGATEPAPPTGAVFVDPLGFLVFGPSLGAELSLEPISLLAYGRWFSVGALSKSMFTDGEEAFAFSYGAGVGGRYWPSEALRGLHLGLLVEYLSVQIDDESVLITSKSSYMVPQLDAGYRAELGTFFVGVRGSLGYALRMSSSIEDLPGGNSAYLYEPEDVNQFYGSASLDVGVYF